MTTTTTAASSEMSCDRSSELKQFDDSKAGVKGLVDSGLTSLPRFFVHPPETLLDLKKSDDDGIIPTIDLTGIHDSERRPAIVEQVSSAAREFGFFQVVNHGVATRVLERAIGGVKAFHEQPADVKAEKYRREMSSGVAFFSNLDLFYSAAASWRDTLQVYLGATLKDVVEIPEICRDEIVEWDKEATCVAELLMELLCEGLGLESKMLKQRTCLEGRTMVGHYYPYCPQSDLTFGITPHADPGILTLLLQDHVGGLQIKYGGRWVDVKPVQGALVINIGDILQIMSNDEYKSVGHRVLANPSEEPRISVATFFNPSARDTSFGPFPELISPEKPAIYKHFTFADFMRRFFTRGLVEESLTDYYKLKTE